MEASTSFDNRNPSPTTKHYSESQSGDRSVEGAVVIPNEPHNYVPTKAEEQHDDAASQPAIKPGPGRKSRACNECKRQKMKCEVPAGSRKCKHCLRRKIECSLQFAKPPRPVKIENGPSGRSSSIAETYEQKIDLMRSELHLVRRTLDTLVDRGSVIKSPSVISSHAGLVLPEMMNSPQSHRARPSFSEMSAREDNMQMAMTRENSVEADQTGSEDVAVEEPMSSLYEVTKLRNIRSSQAKIVRAPPDGGTEVDDLISRGIISEREADELYMTFHTSLNHYLWVGLEQVHSSLQSVRRSSELLTATILVVTALHIPNSADTFDKCYKEFLSLISSSMFSRYHSIDDVRGLVIGAFWLSDVSWKLSGHAIRIATELGIHQSFHRALSGDREHFLRARLWYMIYVCDRHFSLGYGRPPMVSESLQIREVELFRELSLADGLDQRILSQVAVMSMLTRINDRFVEQRMPQQGWNGAALSEEDFDDMRSFNLEIDQWRMRWYPRQEINHFIGTFPLKGVIMYSLFAKLQLNVLAVRGISISRGRMSTQRKEFANLAVSAAVSILNFVQEEEDMRRALVGMPLYFHTMITFAAVFLMKMTPKWNSIAGLNVDPAYTLELLERLVALLKSCITSERHLIRHIAAGLEKILAKSRAATPGVRRTDESSGSNISTGLPTSDERHNPYTGVGGMAQMQNQMVPLSTAAAGFNDPTNGGSWVPFDPAADMTDLTIMNDGWIHESFGPDSDNAVYNLLTSQFAY